MAIVNCKSTLLSTNMEFIRGDNGTDCINELYAQCNKANKQHVFESLNFEECTFNYSEEEIDNMIMEIFEYSFCMNSK